MVLENINTSVMGIDDYKINMKNEIAKILENTISPSKWEADQILTLIKTKLLNQIELLSHDSLLYGESVVSEEDLVQIIQEL